MMRARARHSLRAAATGAALISLSCQDGLARVLDYNTEKLIFSCRSQYGAVLCSAWSPDNEYIITGGEDDMVVVWSTHDKCAVARCLGHNSWLSDLAFDPMHCVTTSDSRAEMGSFLEGSNYRFVSVAQDGRMCVWDLNQVRAQTHTHARTHTHTHTHITALRCGMCVWGRKRYPDAGAEDLGSRWGLGFRVCGT